MQHKGAIASNPYDAEDRYLRNPFPKIVRAAGGIWQLAGPCDGSEIGKPHFDFNGPASQGVPT